MKYNYKEVELLAVYSDDGQFGGYFIKEGDELFGMSTSRPKDFIPVFKEKTLTMIKVEDDGSRVLFEFVIINGEVELPTGRWEFTSSSISHGCILKGAVSCET